jgi:hypothetical protein
MAPVIPPMRVTARGLGRRPEASLSVLVRRLGALPRAARTLLLLRECRRISR